MDSQDLLLFQPIKIKNLELKNRLVMPAVATNFADEGGCVSPRMVDYYEARARGGVGLIIVEAAMVEPRAMGHGSNRGSLRGGKSGKGMAGYQSSRGGSSRKG